MRGEYSGLGCDTVNVLDCGVVMVALGDMSRDALVRELRVAQSFRNLKRVEQIKYWLAKKNKARSLEPEHQPAAPIRGYVDD